MPTVAAKVTELAREGVEMKRKNVKLSGRNSDMETKIVDTCAAKSTMRSQFEVVVRQITVLKTQPAGAKLALKTLANKLSMTEANIRAQMAATGELLRAEKARVQHLEHEGAAEIKKKQKLLAERCEVSRAVSCQMVADEETLHILHSKDSCSNR